MTFQGGRYRFLEIKATDIWDRYAFAVKMKLFVKISNMFRFFIIPLDYTYGIHLVTCKTHVILLFRHVTNQISLWADVV